jgi:AraC-like DNA-binding protein/quercetin dioxygenase-like cupin family protein
MMKSMKTDQAYFQLLRLQEFNNLELLIARYKTHVFPRHWNDTYVIQVVEQGVNELHCRGATHRVSTGSILFINPHEIHTGSSVGQALLAYRSLYPTPELMAEVASQCGDRLTPIPGFSALIVSDTRLAAMFVKAHRVCEARADALTTQTALLDLLALLIQRHFDKQRPMRPLGNEITAVKRAKEYLTDNFNKNISLEALAQIAYLSPFHLLRAFRNAVGLPPHEYLVNVRIERARQLLAQGRAIADVAFETGFFDQCHLHRHFKRIVGVTPGQYLKKSNFVQNF